MQTHYLPLLILVFLLGAVAWRPARSRFQNHPSFRFPNRLGNFYPFRKTLRPFRYRAGPLDWKENGKAA
jgi:hypothetical protein